MLKYEMVTKMYLCVCVCVCVRERERDNDRIDLWELKFPNCSKLACRRDKAHSGSIKCGEFLD